MLFLSFFSSYITKLACILARQAWSSKEGEKGSSTHVVELIELIQGEDITPHPVGHVGQPTDQRTEPKRPKSTI